MYKIIVCSLIILSLSGCLQNPFTTTTHIYQHDYQDIFKKNISENLTLYPDGTFFYSKNTGDTEAGTYRRVSADEIILLGLSAEKFSILPDQALIDSKGQRWEIIQ